MTKTILIVDDDRLNLTLFTDLLRLKGYETVQAADAAQAMALSRSHRPDLILMDVVLPDLSGLDAARNILDERAGVDLPIIAVTAFHSREDEEKAMAAGCTGYLVKPIAVTDLLETVHNLIGPAASGPAAAARGGADST